MYLSVPKAHPTFQKLLRDPPERETQCWGREEKTDNLYLQTSQIYIKNKGSWGYSEEDKGECDIEDLWNGQDGGSEE